MYLNTLAPAPGAKHSGKRVGRGMGSGLGKTGGRGHKGQKSRSGGSVKPCFDGGQMPIQRRLPKSGFTSRKSLVTDQVTLIAITTVEGYVVSLESLKATGLIKKEMLFIKGLKSGDISRAVTISGLKVTKGALESIKAAGGKVEE